MGKHQNIAAEIAKRLNTKQKKALIDMPDKPRRVLNLSPVDTEMMKGLCIVGQGWFVMSEIGHQVRDVLMVAAAQRIVGSR